MKHLRIVILIGSMGLLIFLFAQHIENSIGDEAFIVNFLNRCPAVLKVLGPHIEKKLSFHFGAARISAGFGSASDSLRVKGQKGEGIVDYELEMHRSSWQLVSGNLKISEQMMDLLECEQKD